MDREFAILVLNACYRASRELGEIGVMTHDFAPGDEGKALKHQAGAAVAEIGRITESIFKAHPDLEAYVEGRIDKYGRLS
jgi:hypothetical protein